MHIHNKNYTILWRGGGVWTHTMRGEEEGLSRHTGTQNSLILSLKWKQLKKIINHFDS